MLIEIFNVLDYCDHMCTPEMRDTICWHLITRDFPEALKRTRGIYSKGDICVALKRVTSNMSTHCWPMSKEVLQVLYENFGFTKEEILERMPFKYKAQMEIHEHERNTRIEELLIGHFDFLQNTLKIDLVAYRETLEDIPNDADLYFYLNRASWFLCHTEEYPQE
eukprot:1083085-Pleurochrysis_carterae.AAC.1